jgi:hypothetical protein
MASSIGSNVKFFFKKMPVDVYPLAAVTTMACSLGVGLLWHSHASSPDAVASIKKRTPPEYTFPGINQNKDNTTHKNLFPLNPAKWRSERARE